jgi:transcriptional regulator with XRE-family HTH domain
MNRRLKSSIYLRFGSQEDFASAVKENPSVVSRVIRGRMQLSAEKMARWAETLGFEIEYLFPDADNLTPDADQPKSGGEHSWARP